MGLLLTESKTKYAHGIIMKGPQSNGSVAEQMRFEVVETFKYLGVGLETTSGQYEEV